MQVAAFYLLQPVLRRQRLRRKRRLAHREGNLLRWVAVVRVVARMVPVTACGKGANATLPIGGVVVAAVLRVVVPFALFAVAVVKPPVKRKVTLVRVIL